MVLLNHTIEEKLQKVKQILQKKKVLVAFSGGVDSSVATRLAKEYCLKVLAVTVKSKTNPLGEIEAAKIVAEEIGVEWRKVEIDELNDAQFRANPLNRCYFCKKSLMTELRMLADEEELDLIIDGTNADDLKDYRPGALALQELNIKSPLAEAGITKKEIRMIAHQFNLSVSDKPSMACLASRFPYGEEITEKKLQRIAEAERLIKELANLSVIRVRYHGDIARIEVHSNEREKLFSVNLLDEIAKALKKLGFIYVTLDIQGYRSGSMNEPIDNPLN